ncbi:hypothetical protein [Bacteroides xylanisolvens]|uniref:hypothetical protein n=1 Tax=Bacteroides xylanisolvens TaxID=371601 RepID=UPI001898CF3F|nr:hypothetical protein [Bacteroides xylanisolvens]
MEAGASAGPVSGRMRLFSCAAMSMQGYMTATGGYKVTPARPACNDIKTARATITGTDCSTGTRVA